MDNHCENACNGASIHWDLFSGGCCPQIISVFQPPLLLVPSSPQNIVWTHLPSILLQLELEKRTSENVTGVMRVSSWERSLKNTTVKNSRHSLEHAQCGNLSSADSYKVKKQEYNAFAKLVHLRGLQISENWNNVWGKHYKTLAILEKLWLIFFFFFFSLGASRNYQN